MIFYEHRYHNNYKNLCTLKINYLFIDQLLCMIYHCFQKTYFFGPYLYYARKKIFLNNFYWYHGKIFWVFLFGCLVIIMCIYVYIVMSDYLCVYIVVMGDYF